MQTNTLRLLLFSALAIALFATEAASESPVATDPAEPVTQAEMKELLAVADAMGSRLAEQLDEQIERLGSEILARRGAPEISGSPPSRTQPVASRAHAAAPDSPAAASEKRMLYCLAMPDKPMTCGVAQSPPQSRGGPVSSSLVSASRNATK
jgi:hypothetical protein